ncbi:MAG TPA: OmpW family outer membrane protein, partial [Steroidobacteraceae bacterium]|nr:OmpW family outer membrane protein [Steroidobacteraceae bacterium]
MAASVELTTWRPMLLLCGLAIACALPATARGDASLDAQLDGAARRLDTPPPAPRAWWWRDGADRLHKLVRDVKRRSHRTDPDWLRYRSGSELVEARMSATNGDLCLVLQEDRPDGTDLLTARYTLQDRGVLRTYAGAGLNRAQYFHDDPDEPGPTRFSKRNRSTSMGMAAELGAELQFSERVRVNADLRWADLDGRARALR